MPKCECLKTYGIGKSAAKPRIGEGSTTIRKEYAAITQRWKWMDVMRLEFGDYEKKI